MEATQGLGDISDRAGGRPGLSHVSSPRVYEPTLSGSDQRAAYGWLTLLVFAGLALRGLLLFIGPINAPEQANVSAPPVVDQLAANLTDRHAFVAWAQSSSTPNSQAQLDRHRIVELQHQSAGSNVGSTVSQPETFKMPGYPAFLAAVGTLGGSNLGLLTLQCVISALLGVGVFGITRTLFHRTGPALLAAAVAILHPSMIVAPLALTDDVVFAGLMVGAIWAATQRTGRMALLAGGLFSLAGLVRPIAFWIGPAVGLWMLVCDRKVAGLVPAVVVACLSLVGPGLWMVRNTTVKEPAGGGPRLSTQRLAGDVRTAAMIDLIESGGDLPTRLPGKLDQFYGSLSPGSETSKETSEVKANAKTTAHSTSATRGRRRTLADPRETRSNSVDGSKAETRRAKPLSISKQTSPLDELRKRSKRPVTEHPLAYSALFSHQLGSLLAADTMAQLYRVTGLGSMPRTFVHSWTTGRIALPAPTRTDTGAEVLAFGWFALGVMVFIGGVLGIALMVVRGKWHALLLGIPAMAYLVLAVPTFGVYHLQTQVISLQAILLAAIFARSARPLRLDRPKREQTIKQQRDALVFDPASTDDATAEVSSGIGRPL